MVARRVAPANLAPALESLLCGTNIPAAINFGILVLAYPAGIAFAGWARTARTKSRAKLSPVGRQKEIMDAPQDFDALKRRLIDIEPELPKRLRQTAAFALEHPDEVALGTASSIAERAQVQASTLVRFAQTLGFAGFSELQGVFRTHLRNRWPDYSERLKALHEGALDSGDPLRLLFGFADSAAASIAKLRRAVHRKELDEAIALLARARTIYLLGQRRSFCVSHYLAYALAQLGVGAALIDNVGGLGPEQLAGAGPNDALIAVSFSPIRRSPSLRSKRRERRRPRSSSSPTAR